jgi:NAD(P)-dependent dehydrogenase (short-subunit alcohol dehydrogenase family)
LPSAPHDLSEKCHRQAVGKVCDVTDFDQQAAVFALAVSEFQNVDIVLASAGITESGEFHAGARFKDGKLHPPNLKTLDVNLTGTLYTFSLALNYFKRNPAPKKAFVIMGSLSGFFASTFLDVRGLFG